jgi:hypothetical protein
MNSNNAREDDSFVNDMDELLGGLDICLYRGNDENMERYHPIQSLKMTLNSVRRQIGVHWARVSYGEE